MRWYIAYCVALVVVLSATSCQAIHGTKRGQVQAAYQRLLHNRNLTKLNYNHEQQPPSHTTVVPPVTRESVTTVKPDGKIQLWAVLVAGSQGYYNYRHQADVCHAYQILRRNGIPEENIIVMMYDDVANAPENPTKGVIINEPNGPDVYAGVKIDYRGKNVTPENFKKVLLGDVRGLKGIGSGKVLKSDADDHVFVNFVDHGAPGLLAFPNDELHARDFQDTLLDMYQKKLYGKMVLYIEACESGSMFENLLPNTMNIYVTTAANPNEHSYACYYDSKRQTYLGDVYSVFWMQDSEQKNLEKESLWRQFVVVRTETNTSHVQEYGQLNMGKSKVAEFQGTSTGRKNVTNGISSHPPSPLLDAVPSGDVPLHIMQRKIELQSNEQQDHLQKELKALKKKRKFVTDAMKELIHALTPDKTQVHAILHKRQRLTNFPCYEQTVKNFSRLCFKLSQNEFALRQLYVLVNLCENGLSVEKIEKAMSEVCSHPPMSGIF